MTVEEEMIICKDAHSRKIDNDPVNIARRALKSLEINPLPDQKTKRIIEELKSMPSAPHDDEQDAAVLLNPKLQEKYIDELNTQPVLDGPLPKFCIAHHCTKRSKACDKCAYTAFSSSHRRKLEE